MLRRFTRTTTLLGLLGLSAIGCSNADDTDVPISSGEEEFKEVTQCREGESSLSGDVTENTLLDTCNVTLDNVNVRAGVKLTVVAESVTVDGRNNVSGALEMRGTERKPVQMTVKTQDREVSFAIYGNVTLKNADFRIETDDAPINQFLFAMANRGHLVIDDSVIRGSGKQYNLTVISNFKNATDFEVTIQRSVIRDFQTGISLRQASSETGIGVEIVKRPDVKAFVVVPKRWVVERTFG